MRLPWRGLWRDIVLNTLIASPIVPANVRWRLLRLYGLEIKRSRIASGVWIGSARLSVGEATFINTGCFFNTSGSIAIGDRCDIGMYVTFVTGTHLPGGPGRRAGTFIASPIVIGDGTWIGARATILPGVNIGAGVVIGAGAVVAHDCQDNCLYGGVPARKLKDFST